MRQRRFHWALRQFDGGANFALIVCAGTIILCVAGSFYDLGLDLTVHDLPTVLFMAAVAFLLKIVSVGLRHIGRYIDDGSA